ncbi:IclR family transcriptional regulator C-terminal domain-containing protein [Streptomyces rochei]|uniref:IclR family transcriptional regulator domain-containing protein n=1 Tax=Streptomyces rochei TaxID=1928 RepID=UPI0036FBEEB1
MSCPAGEQRLDPGPRRPGRAYGAGVRAVPWSASLRRYTTRPIAGPGRLQAELIKVRDARIGYSQGELTAGTASVAAPVFDAEGRFIAALGVLAPEAEQMNRLAPAVRRAADAISRRLPTST